MSMTRLRALLPPTMTIVKTCRCGQDYTAAQWNKLRLVGTMDDGEGGVLELRDCVCGSTIAIDGMLAAAERTLARLRAAGLR